jgi:hypothetical protein
MIIYINSISLVSYITTNRKHVSEDKEDATRAPPPAYISCFNMEVGGGRGRVFASPAHLPGLKRGGEAKEWREKR